MNRENRRERLATSSVPVDAALLEYLIAGIRARDSEALAEFLVIIESRLRRRFRRRMRPAVRRLFDTDDLVAFTYLRLEEFLQRGGFVSAATPEALWSLARQTASNIIAAWERRLDAETRAMDQWAHGTGQCGEDGEVAVLEEVLESLEDDFDRRIVTLRACGHTWPQIARLVSLPATALRQRFVTIKRKLGGFTHR
jgi:hypothetical protein